MFQNFFKIILRNTLRYKVFSFINIAGLAVGITCFITISLFILDEFGYDKFNEKAYNIYRLLVDSEVNGQGSVNSKTPAPLGHVLKKDFPEVENFSRVGYFGQFNFRYGNKVFRENDVYTADSTFFDIFTLPLIAGDAKTALVKPNSIVISETAAKKYFGKENPLWKTITVYDTATFLVTGVMKNFPKKSHFSCNYLLSMSTYPISEKENWLDLWYTTYIVLKDGTNPKEFENKMKQIVLNYLGPQAASILGFSMEDFYRKGNRYEYHVQPLTSIYLYSRSDYGVDMNTEWGNTRKSDISYTYIFLAIGGFILLIAIINFMNLATARSEKRAKEVGIRKTLGSDKSKLIWQFITESIFMCFLSVLLALVLLQFALPAFNDFIERDLKLEFFNLHTIPLLILFTIVIGIISGSYPAFYLSSFRPVQIMKSNTAKKSRKSMLRSLLVIIQFAISITLIIGTLVIKSQLDFIQNKNLGFNKEHLIAINNASSLGKRIEAFKYDLQNIPNVVSSTASSLMFQSGIPGNGYLYNKTSGADVFTTQYLDVDYDFAKTYQIKLTEGRFFSKDFSTDIDAVVMNEAAVKECKAANPVGRFLTKLDVFTGMQRYNIIGVVKDFNYESLHSTIRPLVFHLSSVRQASTILTIRVSSNDIGSTISSIEKLWKEYVENENIRCTFIDENIARMYRAEQKIGDITTVFSFLAIFIACLGLFGLAAFVTEQRVKEIGIRKVLGASISEIIILLSKEFTKWVILANLIAFPVAYYIMNNWLEDFAYRIYMGWWIFISSGVLALVIALTTVSYQAVKAATSNPVDSLKYE
ncbi:MAG: ABC transporter permease [bacterium]